MSSAEIPVRKAGLFPSAEQLELLGTVVDYKIDAELIAKFWIYKMEVDLWGEKREEEVGKEKMRTTSTEHKRDQVTGDRIGEIEASSADIGALKQLENGDELHWQRFTSIGLNVDLVLKYFSTVSRFASQFEEFLGQQLEMKYINRLQAVRRERQLRNLAYTRARQDYLAIQECLKTPIRNNVMRQACDDDCNDDDNDDNDDGDTNSDGYKTENQSTSHQKLDRERGRDRDRDRVHMSAWSCRGKSMGPIISLSALLELCKQRAHVGEEGLYFLCDLDETMELSGSIETLPMTFREKYMFCMAPVMTDSEFVMSEYKQFAKLFAYSRKVL